MGRSGSAAARFANRAWRHRDRRHRTALVPLRRRLAPVCQDKPWSGDSDDEAFEEDDDEE